ncbi:hypothetical protein ABMA71_15645, partial [Halobacteriovorax sp. ZH3_bin.1]
MIHPNSEVEQGELAKAKIIKVSTETVTQSIKNIFSKWNKCSKVQLKTGWGAEVLEYFYTSKNSEKMNNFVADIIADCQACDILNMDTEKIRKLINVKLASIGHENKELFDFIDVNREIYLKTCLMLSLLGNTDFNYQTVFLDGNTSSEESAFFKVAGSTFEITYKTSKIDPSIRDRIKDEDE